MALWHGCNGGWSTTTFARRNLGADVFVCCPGPSLAAAAIKPGPGIFVAALNTAYPHVRPDIWFGMDDPQCYDRRLWWEGFPKVYRGNYKDRTCEGLAVKDAPMTFFADLEECRVDEIFSRRAHDVKFGWFKHTLGTALHVLTWMGARRIRMVGCDMGGAADYYYGSPLSPERRAGNRRLYQQQVEFMRRFAQHAARSLIEVISCTPDSPLNSVLPYVPLDKALVMAASSVPGAGVALHCQDVSPTKIKGPTFSRKAVAKALAKSKLAGGQNVGRSLGGADGDVREGPGLAGP